MPPDPIAFSAYLAPARGLLTAEADEAKITFQISPEDAAILLANWRRLNGKVLHIAIVPADEIPKPAPGDLRRGGWSRKPRKPQRAGDSSGAVE